MKKLKKSFLWVKREQRSEGADGEDACVAGTESRPFGLFVLYPLSSDAEAAATGSKIDVDIVAVHGLNGHAKKTWTHPESGICWLEHLLPDALPRARIMTFGYDSGLAFSRSRAGLDTFARDLLNRLRMVRVGSEAESRPLVFVAHSLGGIVVKKAIVLAHETAAQYGPILASTAGIAFMGTPHRGSGLASWATLLANVTNSLTLGQGVRNDLLRNLRQNSDLLKDVSRQFVHRAAPLKIWTFVEQRFERPLTVLVVPVEAAVLNLPNEMIVPLNAHHRDICRFGSRDSNYVLLEAALIELAYQTSTPHATTLPQVTESTKSKKAPWPVEAARPPHAPSKTPTGTPVTLPQVPSAPSHVLAHFGCNLVKDSTPEFTSAAPLLPQDAMKHLTLSTRLISPREMEVGNEQGAGVSGKSASCPDMLVIRVSGLKKRLSTKSYGSGTFSSAIQVPPDAMVESLKDRLLGAYPDLKYWECFLFPGCNRKIDTTWTDVLTTAVEATNGRSVYDPIRGHLKINQGQTIASFFSEVFPHPVRTNLDHETSSGSASASSDIFPERVAIGQGQEPGLFISFVRTVRVPEDGSEYDLPPNTGLFPIFDVRHFSSQLPASMVAKGGLCIPMHDMEAMSIYFDMKAEGRSFAVRPYVGGVNGISGKPVMGGETTSQMSSISEQQDYIVLPEQKWLNGIATALGVVRQFVATKMVPSRPKESHQPRNITLSGEGNSGADSEDTDSWGSNDSPGATVEWQITGEDNLGGIQLQLIPDFNIEKMSATSERDVCALDRDAKLITFPSRAPPTADTYDVLKTPKELGLQVGSFIHMKDMAKRQSSRPKTIMDLIRESPANLKVGDVIELQVRDATHSKWKFNIREQDGAGRVVSLWFASDDKFDEILDVVRDRFSKPEISLLMDHVLPNEAMTVINSWEDLEVVLSAAAMPGKQQYHQIRESGLCTEADLVVGNTKASEPQQPLGLCIVSDGAYVPKFCDEQDICLVLGSKATVRDLRQGLEHCTGKSTAAYAIKVGGLTELDDTDRVFDGSRIPGMSPHTHLRITFNNRPKTVVLKVKCFRERSADVEVWFKIQTKHLVKKLALAIETHMGAQLRLLFNGERLDLDYRLSDYELIDGDVIEAFEPVYGGGSLSLFVRYNGLEKWVSLDFLMTIESIKTSIASWTNVPKDFQRLSYDGKVLDNEDQALKYQGKVLDLALHPNLPTASGIGAGGKIRQNIKRDTNNPRIWDVANAKLLNIQILDSTTFGLVTGVAPPNAPMSAERYGEMGAVFFQMQQLEDKEKGVAGDWAPLVGVAEGAIRNSLRGWGNMDLQEGDDETQSEVDEDKKESLYFPVVLLDVDDTIPPFRGAVEDLDAPNRVLN